MPQNMTALKAAEKFHIEVRPAIHEGKILSNAVCLKCSTSYGGRKTLDEFCALMKLEHKDITGHVYEIALVPLKQFNAASAEIPDPPAPPPAVEIDPSEFGDDEDAPEEEDEPEE